MVKIFATRVTETHQNHSDSVYRSTVIIYMYLMIIRDSTYLEYTINQTCGCGFTCSFAVFRNRKFDFARAIGSDDNAIYHNCFKPSGHNGETNDEPKSANSLIFFDSPEAQNWFPFFCLELRQTCKIKFYHLLNI